MAMFYHLLDTSADFRFVQDRLRHAYQYSEYGHLRILSFGGARKPSDFFKLQDFK
jgi:hypothetical protein